MKNNIEWQDINELDEGIYRVNNYNSRSDLVNDLKQYLPFYVLYEEKIVFKAYAVSKKYFRDQVGEEIFGDNGDSYFSFPRDTEKMAVSSGQIICKTKEDADRISKHFMAIKVKERFPNLKRKYLKYQAFIDDNPEYFISFIFIKIMIFSITGITIPVI